MYLGIVLYLYYNYYYYQEIEKNFFEEKKENLKISIDAKQMKSDDCCCFKTYSVITVFTFIK